ncbi:MAG: hypothetical protein KAJ19_17840 [Gammaproteobacteria bacterium]|nr:hypothetical protein [Gammaproteobacteria bacterium]
MKERVCTKEQPYPQNNMNLNIFWRHPDAEEIRERDINYSTYVTYKCPNCELQFEVELPD